MRYAPSYCWWPVEDVSTAQLMRGLYTSFSASHGEAALGLSQGAATCCMWTLNPGIQPSLD